MTKPGHRSWEMIAMSGDLASLKQTLKSCHCSVQYAVTLRMSAGQLLRGGAGLRHVPQFLMRPLRAEPARSASNKTMAVIVAVVVVVPVHQAVPSMNSAAPVSSET